MYFIQRKFIRRLAAVSSLLFSSGAFASLGNGGDLWPEPGDFLPGSEVDSTRGFWTGNGSIMSYYDSQGRANVQDKDNYPNGVKQDVTMAHPGYPVAFFQWQATKGSCERLEIAADVPNDAPNDVKMVDITVGPWNSRDRDVTFEKVHLPFVIGEGNMGISFNDDHSSADAHWRVVSVAFKESVSEDSKVTVTCTDHALSTLPFTRPGKPIILEGNYKWNGNGSIISGLFILQDPKVSGEWPNGAFQDVTRVSSSPEKPVVFFQWMASQICTELTIDAPDLPPNEKQVSIISKPWYASNDDGLSEKLSGTLPMIVHNSDPELVNPWHVIQVAFANPVSQIANVVAKCALQQGADPVAQPLSREAHPGEKVAILDDLISYEILALNTIVTGCDSGIYWSSAKYWCNVNPDFIGTITIPYRLKGALGRYSDSTITITVSPVPTPPPPFPSVKVNADFCSSPVDPPATGLSLSGDDHKDSRWPTGSTLTVAMKFDGHGPTLPWPCQTNDTVNGWQSCFDKVRTQIEKVVETWSQYGNIHFLFRYISFDGDFVSGSGGGMDVSWEKADIRIGFAEDGAWSMIGKTGCQSVLPPKKTMNLAFSMLKWNQDDPSDPGKWFRRRVLHEFGHAIGFYHEHTRKDRPYTWTKTTSDENIPTRDSNGNPIVEFVPAGTEVTVRDSVASGWTLEKAKTNLVTLNSPVHLFSTEYDPNSIMIYPIPARWVSQADLDNPNICPDYKIIIGLSLVDGPVYKITDDCVGWNTELSEIDMKGIRQFYPF